MKEEYFNDIETTRAIFKKAIENRQQRLDYTKKQLAEKGENALPPDEFAVYSAQVALDMVTKNYEAFEAEVARREKQKNNPTEVQPGE